MTNSQKLALRLSEIRQRLNEIGGLTGDAFTDEIRSESETLQTEFKDTEIRWRSAEIAESTVEPQAAGSEERELQTLIQGASVGRIFENIIEHRSSDGREAEVQAHFKLGGNQIPLAMLRTEHRAVTAAPADVGTESGPDYSWGVPSVGGRFPGCGYARCASGR